MKRTLFLAALAAGAISAMAQDFKGIEYTVSGKVPENVKMVYFLNDGDKAASDSAQVKDGTFEYKGFNPEFSVMTAVAGDEALKYFCDATPVAVDFIAKAVAGSALNNKFSLYQHSAGLMHDKMMAKYNEYRKLAASDAADKQERLGAIEEELNGLEKKYNSIVLGIINTNKDNFIPTAFLGDIVYELSYDELKGILNEDVPYYNSPSASVKKAKRVLAGMEKRQPGIMFVDLEIPGIDGRERKLSEWCGKGNYVLIDFWASWCGPCRMEMPNVVANYEKYHQKGFEIVGISFDNKADAWKKAVMDLGMKWPQVSNLKGWQSAGAAEYGIMSIPASILLDGEGKIVAIDLRGDALGNKLKEVYGF